LLLQQHHTHRQKYSSSSFAIAAAKALQCFSYRHCAEQGWHIWHNAVTNPFHC
jgi:hypothetical protein